MDKFSRRSRRGVVLIPAMLVMATVASAASVLMLGQNLWFRRVENLQDRAQLIELERYAMSAATTVMSQDFPKMTLDGATLDVQLLDAQGRFNLNSLLHEGVPSPADIGVFERLLHAQGLDSRLSAAVLDWMDADTDMREDGAEDDYYMTLPDPYHAANAPFESVEELRYVKGFSDEAVDRLRPLLCALPESTRININTAPGPILQALFTSLSDAALQRLLSARARQAFVDGNAMIIQAGQAPANDSTWDIKSAYFFIVTHAHYGTANAQAEGLVHGSLNGVPGKLLWMGEKT